MTQLGIVRYASGQRSFESVYEITGVRYEIKINFYLTPVLWAGFLPTNYNTKSIDSSMRWAKKPSHPTRLYGPQLQVTNDDDRDHRCQDKRDTELGERG